MLSVSASYLPLAVNWCFELNYIELVHIYADGFVCFSSPKTEALSVRILKPCNVYFSIFVSFVLILKNGVFGSSFKWISCLKKFIVGLTVYKRCWKYIVVIKKQFSNIAAILNTLTWWIYSLNKGYLSFDSGWSVFCQCKGIRRSINTHTDTQIPPLAAKQTPEAEQHSLLPHKSS